MNPLPDFRNYAVLRAEQARRDRAVVVSWFSIVLMVMALGFGIYAFGKVLPKALPDAAYSSHVVHTYGADAIPMMGFPQ